MSQSLKRPSTDSSETEPQSASDGTNSLPEGAEAVGPEVMPVEEGAPREKTKGAVNGEHTCSECGMVFQRRYTLIMHMLKHEKSRSFKCTVRICSVMVAYFVWFCLYSGIHSVRYLIHTLGVGEFVCGTQWFLKLIKQIIVNPIRSSYLQW